MTAIQDMSKDELLDLGEQMGLDVSAKMRKDELRQEIEAAQARAAVSRKAQAGDAESDTMEASRFPMQPGAPPGS